VTLGSNRGAAFTPLQLSHTRKPPNISKRFATIMLKRAEARAPVRLVGCAASELTFHSFLFGLFDSSSEVE
jgi:hypothetical protein